jgi:hypothetical protein
VSAAVVAAAVVSVAVVAAAVVSVAVVSAAVDAGSSLLSNDDVYAGSPSTTHKWLACFDVQF